MWFDSWPDIARIALGGVAAYATLVVVLRVSGKRTLSQLNVFDFVVTVALGSILATTLVNSDVTWSEGATAFILVAGLQFVVAWVSSRWPAARRLVTSKPVRLVEDGVVLVEAMKKCRLTESEVHQAIRSSGLGTVTTIAAVVLETNGKLSVIQSSSYGDGSALADVKR